MVDVEKIGKIDDNQLLIDVNVLILHVQLKQNDDMILIGEEVVQLLLLHNLSMTNNVKKQNQTVVTRFIGR
jgi:hypothetical protein